MANTCDVCGNELGDILKCKRCGYSNPGFVGDSAEDQAKRMEIASQYRKKYWNHVKIYVAARTNENKDGQIVEKSREFILLGDTAQMEESVIAWYPEDFARQSGNCHLLLKIERQDGTETTEELTLMNPEVETTWNIGLMVDDKRECTIYLGNKKKNIKQKLEY